jgi:hypothetical protein
MDDSLNKNNLYATDLTAVTWYRSGLTLDNPKDYNCVEWAPLPGGAVAVRDSRNPHRGALMFTAEEWDAFVEGIQTGNTRAVP